MFLYREYLATFKKTVAMHEVFLQRIAAHPQLKNDVNFEVFLAYDQDVSKTHILITLVSTCYQGNLTCISLNAFFFNPFLFNDTIFLGNVGDQVAQWTMHSLITTATRVRSL